MFAGIDAAAAPGLTPVNINMVVKRGINDYAIIEMAEHLRATGRILRLIEYMDVGTTYGWRVDDVVPGAEIAAAIHARWLLESLEANYDGEVATRHRYRDGQAKLPLAGDLRELMRGAASDEELTTKIRSMWTHRADR